MSDGWGNDWPSDPAVTAAIKKLVEDNFVVPKELNNTMPTHDPYTNPNAEIYFSCNCGQILDPSTKSFASLCKAAGDQGWKIRWGASSYVAYCEECGKGVE